MASQSPLNIVLFTLAGLIFACTSKNSKKSIDEAPKPQPVGTIVELSGSDDTTPPNIEKPEFPSGKIPIHELPRGIWAISINESPRNCTNIFDFRIDNDLIIHLLCPSADGRSIQLQSETYTYVRHTYNSIAYLNSQSTCLGRPSSGTLVFRFAFRSSGADRALVFQQAPGEGDRSSPEYHQIVEAQLAGNFSQDETLHGQPLIRGCFNNSRLDSFIANEGQQ